MDTQDTQKIKEALKLLEQIKSEDVVFDEVIWQLQNFLLIQEDNK